MRNKNKHAKLAPIRSGWDKSCCGKSLTVHVVTPELGYRSLLSRTGRVAMKINPPQLAAV